jgi:hypothetical protein
MNELIRHKISRKLTGRKLSKSHKKHISESLTNRKLTQSHKDNISKAMKEYRESITTLTLPNGRHIIL